MWPYWLLFIVPAYLAITRTYLTTDISFSSQRNRWSVIWRSFFILLVLMIGLRHEVGGDWETYYGHVESLLNVPFLEILAYYDPAYALLNWLGANVGGGMYLVNIVCAALFSWGLLVFCRAQPRPLLALVIAVPYLITVVAMGYTRQGVAIGIAMLGMEALAKGSTMRFILWIALATCFHKSAVILVPLAVLASTQQRAFTILWAIASGVVLFSLLLRESLDHLIYGYIERAYESSGAAIRILMNAVPAVLFLVFRKRFKLSPKQRSFWTWMAWSAMLFVVLLKISPSSTAVDRVALYWIPLQLFVLSSLPDTLGIKGGKNSVWVYAVVAYSATVHFVWLVFADSAAGWLPYQFFPWIWLWK